MFIFINEGKGSFSTGCFDSLKTQTRKKYDIFYTDQNVHKSFRLHRRCFLHATVQMAGLF
jgi:hypothetical protein